MLKIVYHSRMLVHYYCLEVDRWLVPEFVSFRLQIQLPKFIYFFDWLVCFLFILLLLTIVKPLLCETPNIVDRRDSVERFTAKLLLRCDALHLTDMICEDFLYVKGILFNLNKKKKRLADVHLCSSILFPIDHHCLSVHRDWPLSNQFLFINAFEQVEWLFFSLKKKKK